MRHSLNAPQLSPPSFGLPQLPLLVGFRAGPLFVLYSTRTTNSSVFNFLALHAVHRSGKSGYLGGIYPAGLKGAAGWAQISAVAQVPADATSLDIMVYTRKGCVGTAWFDAVSLTPLGSWAEMRTTLLSPVYRGRITTGGGGGGNTLSAGPGGGGGCKAITIR
eukprot:SAG22_NODE_913_length_6527_cov_2.919726_11_plen_163_part_00